VTGLTTLPGLGREQVAVGVRKRFLRVELGGRFAVELLLDFQEKKLEEQQAVELLLAADSCQLEPGKLTPSAILPTESEEMVVAPQA